MAVLFSPWGNQQFNDESGNPATGWKIYTYAAGSSTPLATYTTSAGSVAQENPIVLNSLGFVDSPIWLTSGLAYKLVLTNASGVVKGPPEDNITGVTGTSTTSQWQASGLTPTYVSATSFTLAGDQTSAFHVGRRLQSTNTAGTIYSSISASAYGALTTVTVINDSGVLDSGLSAVNYGLLTAENPSIPPVNEPVNAQTGTTYTYLSSDKGKLVTHSNAAAIAGTLPQAGTTFPAGWWMDAQNRGAGTLTITPTTSTIDGAASLALTTGQGVHIVSDGSNYFTLRGLPSAPNSSIRLNTANGYGSTNTAIRRFTTTVSSTGSDMTYADSATLGASITINTPGIYAISYNDQFNGTGFVGISLNTTQPSTVIYSLTNASEILACGAMTINYPGFAGGTFKLAAGDVVRPHTDAQPTGVNTKACQFTITRVG